MTHVLRYAARTDRGLVRQNNQDSVFAGDRLLVVADGMGGHAAGDKASRLAINAFIPLNDRQPGKDLLGPLDDATHDSNQSIADMVAGDATLDGMGTTITALLFDGNRLGIAHVGDSRAYLWRDGVLSQITHDDTFVQSLIDDGRITEDEAAHHPQRSLLLRAVNGTDTEPTLQQRVLQVGDRYLICSDGLSGVVAPEAIADTLASYEVAPAADRLIELALRGGGPDNVTVIVADVLETGVTPGVPVVEEIDPDADLDATGPILPVHMTQRMPRIPLPEESTGGDVSHLETAPISIPSGDSDHDDEDDEDDDDDLIVAPPVGPEHKWRRRGIIALGLVVLFAILGTGSFFWIRSQYYVGEDNGRVVIYRGVSGSVLGLKLASATEDSCSGAVACIPLQTTDLVQSARSQVLTGIPASGLDDAREVLIRLGNELLPECAVRLVDPEPTPTVAPSTEPTLTTIVTTSTLAPSSVAPSTAPSTAPSSQVPATGTASNPATATSSSTGTASTATGTRTAGLFGPEVPLGAGTDTAASGRIGAELNGAPTTGTVSGRSGSGTATASGTQAPASDSRSPGTGSVASTAPASVVVLTVTETLTPTGTPEPTVTGTTAAAPLLIPGVNCRVVMK